MRGLLMKDIQLIKANKTQLPMFVVIALLLLVTGGESTLPFVVAFFTMMCGMLAFGTVNYDEFEHGSTYLMTLPVTRKGYALEKYVFLLLAMGIGWLVSVTAAVIMAQVRSYSFSTQTLFISSLLSTWVLFLIVSMMLPIQLKFGGERSRVVTMLFIAFILIVVFAGKLILDRMHVDVVALTDGVERVFTAGTLPVAFLLVLAGGVVIVFLSIQVSIHIMKRKEF